MAYIVIDEVNFVEDVQSTINEPASIEGGNDMSLSDEVRKCCPFCGGDGFTVRSFHGEAEQEQCQFCYEYAYPLADRVKELEQELEAALNGHAVTNSLLTTTLQNRDRLREALQHIMRHQTIVAGSLGDCSPTYLIAKQALGGDE